MKTAPTRWRKGMSALAAMFIAVSLIGLAGCSFGPMTICSNRQKYNEAVRDTWNEQFLLNMVRLRYRDPPEFDAITNILASHSFDASVNSRQELRSNFGDVPKGATSVNSAIFNLLVYGASAGISERPTITYAPLEGAEFTKLLLGQVHLETLVLLSRTGWEMDRLLRITTQKANNIENVTNYCEYPEPVPVYQEFAALASHLQALHTRGQMELSFDTTEAKASSIELHGGKSEGKGDGKADGKGDDRDPVNAETMLKAAQAKFDFRTDPVSKATTLWSKKSEEVLRFSEDAWSTVDAQEAVRMLNVPPHLDNYRLIAGAEKGHLRKTQAPDEICISTRSTLGLLIFASKGIDIPKCHYEKGLVVDPIDASGQPFDWSCVMRDIIHVKSQVVRPLHAFCSIHYRGHWYFIADDDLISKTSFALILEIYGLELAGGVVPGPVVTVPVGNGLSAAVPSGGGGKGGGGGGGQ
jgi:hypothetical protein